MTEKSLSRVTTHLILPVVAPRDIIPEQIVMSGLLLKGASLSLSPHIPICLQLYSSKVVPRDRNK